MFRQENMSQSRPLHQLRTECPRACYISIVDKLPARDHHQHHQHHDRHIRLETWDLGPDKRGKPNLSKRLHVLKHSFNLSLSTKFTHQKLIYEQYHPAPTQVPTPAPHSTSLNTKLGLKPTARTSNLTRQHNSKQESHSEKTVNRFALNTEFK